MIASADKSNLSDDQRSLLAQRNEKMAQLKRKQVALFGNKPLRKIEPWHELGKAIFSMKEFIYIR